MFEKWGKGTEPPDWVTKEECQEMIDNAIRKHNRNAGIISMFVGFFILGLFSEGLLRLIGGNTPTIPMDGYSFIEWVGVVTAFLFGITMICQGHFIFHQKHGPLQKRNRKPRSKGQSQTTSRKSRQRKSQG